MNHTYVHDYIQHVDNVLRIHILTYIKNSDFLVVTISVGLAQAHPNCCFLSTRVM